MPADEPGRLRALAEFELDASEDPVLDGLARVAALLTGAEISSVNIVDETRQWVKAAVGAERGSGPLREDSFCTHVVAADTALVVEDALEDPRFATNPATLAGDLRSYAGVPLRTSDGHVIGSFCVWGPRPRRITAPELESLSALAAAAAGHLELRRTSRQLERTGARLDAVLDQAPDAFVSMDAHGCVHAWNREAERLFGWPSELAIGRTVAELIVPAEHRADHLAGLRRFREGGAPTMLNRALELEARHRDGYLVPIDLRIAAVLEGHEHRFNAFARDISERKALEAEQARLVDRLQELSRTDPLTGIANRRTLHEGLGEELVRGLRSGRPLAVVVADLDHFKAYNDAHGHAAGDRLLRDCVAAWDEFLRAGDMLARYGGEEFVVVLPGCGEAEATSIAMRLNASVPDGQSCSCGVAVWDGSESADRLIDRADAALYAAKAAGRSTVRTAAA